MPKAVVVGAGIGGLAAALRLKRLGYQPSPLYKEMLNDLLAATLDGEIKNEEEATAFVRAKY